MTTLEKLQKQLENETDQELIDMLKAKIQAEEAKSKIEIDADLLKNVVASDPTAGWQPKNAFKPIGAELLRSVKQSKRNSPTVEDVLLEFRCNGMTVKTYASNLLALWAETGSKEQLFMQGSTESKRIVNPKLKIGYVEEEKPRDPNFKFKMTIAVK